MYGYSVVFGADSRGYADANTGRGTNDIKSMTGAGLMIVGDGGGVDLASILDVGELTMTIVFRVIVGDAGGEELGRHEGLLSETGRGGAYRSVLENGLLVEAGVFAVGAALASFAGAGARAGRAAVDVGVGIAAHFLLTASAAALPAADALAEISATFCVVGLFAGVLVAAGAQAWSAGKRWAGQNCCLQFYVHNQPR